MENNYQYVVLDFSYILTRNMYAISKGKGVGEYNEGELMRACLWTINKLARDFGLTSSKVVAIYDKWDKSYGGYYTTYLLGGKYKDTRVYMDDKLFEEIKNDPSKTKEEIEKAELELYQNKVKYKAKWGMIAAFKNIGIPCLGVDAWEADNLAYLTSCLLYGKHDKKSVLVTKDSDWKYFLSPSTVYFKIPTGGSKPEIITYDQMYYSIPENLREKGLSLYQYKMFLDSLEGGHNDMRPTKKPYLKVDEVIERVMEGDFSGVDDIELFQRQCSTFDISKYPRLGEAQRIITDLFPTAGRLGGIEEFHSICDKYGIKGVSDKYYLEFINRFDERLYCER